jgi:RHS repeat-associated protein
LKSSTTRSTGEERDTESGLDYFGARYNSSSMERFMSPDPLGGDLTNPQCLNRYSYVLNNPLTNIDPTDMECVWDDGSLRWSR